MKKTLRNIVTLTALTTAGIHVANKLIERNATEKNILSTNAGHFFDWKFGRIYYTKKGTGEPLVLIHDLSPDSSAYEWNNVINNLSKNYTVYTLDLLGCGRSDKPAMNYTGFIYVQLLNDFLKEIVRKPAYVAATGFSSPFTLMASYMEPDKYKKLIFINPTSPEDFDVLPQEKKSLTKRIFELPIFGTYLYNIYVRRNSISKEVLQSVNYNDNGGYLSNFVDAYYEAAHLQSGNGRYLYASMWDEYLNVNIRRGIMEHTIPMLIVESETVAEDENLLDQFKFYNKNITGCVIRNTKCMPQIEDAKKTCEEIRKFFA